MENYEEKYKEIIEKLKLAKQTKGNLTFSSVLDEIPEFQEQSEDEKYKKYIELCLDGMRFKAGSDADKERKKARAWFEKLYKSKNIECKLSEEEKEQVYQIAHDAAIDFGAAFNIVVATAKAYKKGKKENCYSIWKPSKEQLTCLENLINKKNRTTLSNANKSGLIDIYNDLKKLYYGKRS